MFSLILQSTNNLKSRSCRAGPEISGPGRTFDKCPGRAGRPGSLGVAGRGSLILPLVARRGARVVEPARGLLQAGESRLSLPGGCLGLGEAGCYGDGGGESGGGGGGGYLLGLLEPRQRVRNPGAPSRLRPPMLPGGQQARRARTAGPGPPSSRNKPPPRKQDCGETAAARRVRPRQPGTPSSGRRTRTLLAPGRRAAQPVQPALLPCPAGYCGEGPPPAGVSLFVIVLAGSVVSFCRLHQHRHLLLLNDLSYQPARHS